MTAVNLSGTWTKDERPNNGLEEIAQDLIAHQLRRHVVIGIVTFAGSTRPGPGEPESPRVKFLAIEPLFDDAAEQGRQMLDQARKLRNLGLLAESLFDVPAEGPAPAADVPRPGDGQPTIPGSDPVPEASGAELLAEHREAREARKRKQGKDGEGDPDGADR